MLVVYKKVERKLDNPSGIVEINSIDELDSPFLLCISAQPNYDKSIFGIIREGAHAARVYTTQEMAARFKIDDFPVDFLGLRFRKDDLNQEMHEEIVEKFLYPFLMKKKKKKVDGIKKQARRINLMTYCDGTMLYEKIEKTLEEKLTEDGFTETEIDDILSQISLVAIGTMVDTRNFKATSATFIDVNDLEIAVPKTSAYQQLLQDKKCSSFYGTVGKKKNVIYIYDGTGMHELKEYFKDERVVKPAVCSVLSHFLEQSVENEASNNVVTISYANIIEQLNTYADNTHEPASLMQELDSRLSYGNAPRYTTTEAMMRQELDTSYKELQQTRMQVGRMERALQTKEEQVNSLVTGIREYSSKTTFYQILLSASMWQPPKGRDVFKEKSDKDIREEYEEILLMNKQEISGTKPKVKKA